MPNLPQGKSRGAPKQIWFLLLRTGAGISDWSSAGAMHVRFLAEFSLRTRWLAAGHLTAAELDEPFRPVFVVRPVGGLTSACCLPSQSPGLSRQQGHTQTRVVLRAVAL